MAKWRIRHKLMLGIGLVVGIMAFLLVGALAGLSSLRHTMRSIDSKLQELREANAFRADLEALKSLPEVFELSDAVVRTQQQALLAKDQLDLYRERLEATVAAGRDPDNGYSEAQIVEALDERFTKLNKEIGKLIERGVTGSQKEELSRPIEKLKEDLVRTSDDLISRINRSLHQRIAASKRENTISIAVLVSTVTLAVLMTLGFGRIFYRWIVQPVRDLEQGVSRIATGDFDHRLDIRSGDEMEDLAKAYNEMSTKLRDIYRDLHNQVNERSRQLIRSERLAGVGFLAAGVAHEINNPLASIAFCSEALERRLSELFEGRRLTGASRDHLTEERDIVAKYLKMIQEEAFRCKEITQKLLAFSRGGERKREKTDLADLIQGVLDMVQHLQNCRGKSLVFEAATPLDAWVNAQEIKQVFLNLVVNALDSMEEGGTLTITSSHTGEAIELVFKDTGCGMSGEVLENIFEPFFTRSRTGKGTGLGLSISHRIVSSHGGDITAASAGPGQGSVFTVHLPVQPPAELTETGGEDMDPEAEFLKLSTARRQRAAA